MATRKWLRLLDRSGVAGVRVQRQLQHAGHAHADADPHADADTDADTDPRRSPIWSAPATSPTAAPGAGRQPRRARRGDREADRQDARGVRLHAGRQRLLLRQHGRLRQLLQAALGTVPVAHLSEPRQPRIRERHQRHPATSIFSAARPIGDRAAASTATRSATGTSSR